jgi:hypothetical protein
MLLLFALCLCCSCTRIHADKTKCPLLRKYAQREGIPRSELATLETGWPQYVYDYSVSHGPNLSRAEQKEFNCWQVK